MGNVDELIEQYRLEAEQFTLAPSPAVWENIDREINPRRRRRVLFIILFLLGGFAALGFILSGGHGHLSTTAPIVAASANNTLSTTNTSRPTVTQLPTAATTTIPSAIPTRHDQQQPTTSPHGEAGPGLSQHDLSHINSSTSGDAETGLTHGPQQPTFGEDRAEGPLHTSSPLGEAGRGREGRGEVLPRLAASPSPLHASAPVDTHTPTPTAASNVRVHIPAYMPRLIPGPAKHVAIARSTASSPTYTRPIPQRNATYIPLAAPRALSGQYVAAAIPSAPVPTTPIVLHSAVGLPRITPVALTKANISAATLSEPAVASLPPMLPARTYVQPMPPASAIKADIQHTTTYAPSPTSPMTLRTDIAVSPLTLASAQIERSLPMARSTQQRPTPKETMAEQEELLQKKIDETPAEYDRTGLDLLSPAATSYLEAYVTLTDPRATQVQDYIPAFEKEEQPQEERHQEKDSTKTIKNKLGIAGMAGYVHNNAMLTEVGEYQFIKSYRDSTDKQINTLNYSLSLRYVLSDKLTVHASIGINRTGENISSRQVVYKPDTLVVVTAGYTSVMPTSYSRLPIVARKYYDINNDSTGRMNNTLTYMSVNIGATCTFASIGKLGLGLQPSLSLNRLVRSNYYYFDSGTVTFARADKSVLNSWSVSAGIGFVAEYRISRSLSLSLIPHFNRFLSSPYNKPGITDTHYGQTSVNMAVTWWLR